VNRSAEFWATYSLLGRLSSINGPNVVDSLLDRTMYSFQSLPLLGKEYWWLLFFGRDGRQLMLLIFRKYGKSMVLNGERVSLRNVGRCACQVAMTGWFYDGERMRDLGVTNPVATAILDETMLVSELSGMKMVLEGGFPVYSLKLGDMAELNMTEASFLESKCAHGVLIPPFGAGWVDVFLKADGTVLGERFEGTGHLQKVIGIMPYGSFHWSRIVFDDNSVFSMFCLKTGKDSKRYLHASVNFYDRGAGRITRFRNPKLKMTRIGLAPPTWVIESRDEDNDLRIVLESYADKNLSMLGGGSQTYIEYAVYPREFSFKTRGQETTLDKLGKGVGTLEDAYGSPIS
jgi:hypothetical protein